MQMPPALGGTAKESSNRFGASAEESGGDGECSRTGDS
ncbi:hypothetical protein PAMC26510_02425 [Caballeronia sordidicola]|uniref:Uncharacterized protein n=1 Tax=Caballeronia sordidicola TaxID=196367 RepID=A0A242NA22_CABSO|nr:hypothetical protein PAMC26577_07335 [Caballeronia sordidicola]OTP80476.1 hypothetical protein PAMC26510_02425 [Caballeronia sordidicola]